MPPAAPGAAAKLRRLSSQGSQLQLKLLQKSTAGSNHIFGRFAVLATHHPWKLFLLGHVVAFAFALGILTAEKATDINDLWIDTDSRVNDEKKDFESKFGGVGRDLSIALQGRGDGGVATATALAAHQLAVEDLFTAYVTENDVNLTEADFCEKPLVPQTFQAGQPSTVTYTMLSQCLANSTFNFPNLVWPVFLQGLGRSLTTFKPLPTTWGVDSLPCSRGSVLDCFREGGEIDYPQSMKTLEEVAPAIGFAKTTRLSELLQLVLAAAGSPPCWLTDVPPSSDCIKPGANATVKIQVFQTEALNYFSQSSGGTTSPALIANIENAIVGLSAPGTNITDLNNVINTIQTGLRHSEKSFDDLITLVSALKHLQSSGASDWVFRDEVQTCKWQSIQTVIETGVGGIDLTNTIKLVRDGMLRSADVASDPNQYALVRNIEQLNSIVSVLIDAFASFGYWWRPSYKNMSPQEILSVFKGANESEGSATIQVEQCITERSQGRYCCLAWDGSKVGMQIFLGNVDKFPNGTYKSVSAYQTPLTNYDSRSRLWRELLEAKVSTTYSSDQLLRLAERFEGEVMTKKWQPRYDQKEGTGFAPGENYSDYRISFVTTRSLSDILDKGTDVEDEPVIISYCVMIAFICFTLGKVPMSRNCQELIDSHMLLGLYGLFTVAFSTLAGLGFSAIVQMDFTPITTNLAPFVSLGLGVDDMFVLVQSMNHQFRPGDSIETNMIRCMHLAGPSVFLTSIANSVAFFIMASTPTTVIYLFGLAAAINVIFNFIMLHLIFVPAIVLDTRRMMDNRLDVVLVKVTPTPKIEPTQKADEAEKEGSFMRKACKNRITNTGQFVAEVLGNKLKNPIIKACVLIMSVAFTAVMIWAGVDRTEEGLEVSDIALRNTYQHDMSLLQANTFPFENTYLVASSSNFSDPSTQQEFIDCLDSISTNQWLMVGPSVKGSAWLANSSTSLIGIYASSGTNPRATPNTPVPSDQFHTARLEWISAFGSTQFPNLACVDINDKKTWIDCKNTSSYLLSAKVSIYFDNLHTVDNYRDAMRSSRNMVDPHNKNGLKVYMVGNMYYLNEQYLHMNKNALRTTGFTLLGVFFITFIFQFSPILSMLVCLTVAAVVVELWGFFTFIDIKLNPFSVANLAISVGMAVEFTAHIARAFAIAKGTRDERMVAALKEMMLPMYQGAVSTIVSMAALVEASSPFFRIYFSYTFISMTIIAMINGLIVLPVLLSLVGPAEFGTGQEEREKLEEKEEMPAITEDAEKAELGEGEWRMHQ